MAQHYCRKDWRCLSPNTWFLRCLASLSFVCYLLLSRYLAQAYAPLPTYFWDGLGPEGWLPFCFLLLIIEEENIAHREELFAITILTVGLSIILHGVSAAPLSERYGRYLARKPEGIENSVVSDIPLRQGNEKH